MHAAQQGPPSYLFRCPPAGPDIINIIEMGQYLISIGYYWVPDKYNFYIRQQKSMNKTLSEADMSTSSFFMRKKEVSQKRKVIKKILMISSIDKDIVKVLLKMIDVLPPKEYLLDHKAKLKDHSQTILDKDKQGELDEELQKLYQNPTPQQSEELLLKIIKYFILSPIEKSYISRIQQELKEEQELDIEIAQAQEKINQQKNKKLQVYYQQKNGKLVVQPKETIESVKKDNINQENKLERVNQKLNNICASNNKLREKINQLRKEKNVMEEIYTKLKKELETKKENVEATIKSAGQAYYARNQAEKNLETLKSNADNQKEQFKEECQKLNKEIQYDIRFKQFIKSKQKEKATLSKLEEEIRQNQKSIELKKESNLKIELEYKESVAKENEIKKSFERIKKEIGITEVGIENSGKELLNVFVGLYEKNSIMSNFVSELNREVESLEEKISLKKQDIQRACSKEAEVDINEERSKEELKKKAQIQERRKTILKQQYQKSVEAIGIIKQYLQESFEEIGVDREVIDKLKNSSISEENLSEFLGELEKRGIEAISKYSKLVSQHIKASDNSDGLDIDAQINDLNNIITYDNANIMNTHFGDKNILNQYPSELLLKVKDEENIEDKMEKSESKKFGGIMQRDDFRKFAQDSLENFNKKPNSQIHREKTIGNKKFIINNNVKTKKK